MVSKAVKKEIKILAESINHIDGMFTFMKSNGEHLLMSRELKDTIKQEDDVSVLLSHPTDFFKDDAACENINKMVSSSSAGLSGISYFSATNNLGYCYSQFNKSFPVIVNKMVVGAFIDVLPIDGTYLPNSNNQDVLLRWLAHPDILHQSLLEQSAQHRAFYLYKTIITLSVLEIECLYYLLMGYEDDDLMKEFNLELSKVKTMRASIYAKFKIRDLYSLMNLLFSRKLLASYGLNQQKIFPIETMSKVKGLLSVI